MSADTAYLSELVAEDQDVSVSAAQAMVERYMTALKAIQRRQEGYNPAIGAAELESLRTWVDKVFFFKGLPTIVYARMGAGKTYFISWLLLRAMWLHPNWDFFTNIPFFWADDKELERYKPPQLYAPSSMSQMLIMTSNSILNDRVPATLLDEMDSAIVSQSWQSRKNLSWMKFTFVERHLKTRGPVMVYHSASDIPHYLRKINSNLTNTHIKLTLRGGKRIVASRRNPSHIVEVPSTQAIIPYATHGLMGFEIDVDMGKLNDRLHSSRVKVVAQQILDNVEDCLIDSKNDRAARQVLPESMKDETTGKALLHCNSCNHTWDSKQRGPYFTCSNSDCLSRDVIAIPKDQWEKWKR